MKRRLLSNKRWVFCTIAVLAVIFSIILFFPGLKNQSAKGKAAIDNVKPAVDVQMIQRKDMTRKISLVGQTVPEAQIDIAAKYAGRITQVNVSLGQQVSAGQVLVVEDTGDVELTIAQTDASLRQAEADTMETESSFNANYQRTQADYQRSLTNYQRYKSLFDTGAVSRETLDSAEQQMINAKSAVDILANQAMVGAGPAAVESKRAAILKTQRMIDALAKQRDDLILRASRDGIIGYRQVEVGSLVQAGQKLLSLVDNSHIYVDCQMSEQDVAQIRPGVATTVQIESLGRTFKGNIIYISPASDATNHNFTVRIALADMDQSVKSGMFARTLIEVLLRPQTLFVPKEAVLEKNGKSFIFVINGNNQAEQRAVQTGLSNDKEVEILSGVNDGEVIAISNLARLKTGVTIEPNLVAAQETAPQAEPQQGGQL